MAARQIITAHEPVVCVVCQRTLLRGETPVQFLNDGRVVPVCELCEPRALSEGWMRAGDAPDPSSEPRRRERRSLLRRFRGDAPARRDEPAPRRPSVPVHEERQVHGVPANVRSKVDRAIATFNGSGLPQRMAGITRSLGSPVVAVRPSRTEASIVVITVAWELAWYRFEVALGDGSEGVRPVARGGELSELDPGELEPTNAMGADGLIVDAA